MVETVTTPETVDRGLLRKHFSSVVVAHRGDALFLTLRLVQVRHNVRIDRHLELADSRGMTRRLQRRKILDIALNRKVVALFHAVNIDCFEGECTLPTLVHLV
jgi:hypothetical protein